MSRLSTSRFSCSGLSLGGPTNFKACKSFLFTEGSFKVENKEHLIDFLVTLAFQQFVISRFMFYVGTLKAMVLCCQMARQNYWERLSEKGTSPLRELIDLFYYLMNELNDQ